MVKKKRPSDNDGGSTTESCDENNSNNLNNSSSACSHITKSVDPTRLRKAIKQTGIQLTVCSECPEESETTIKSEEDEEGGWMSHSIWLCLKCGSQLCGRTKNKHALNHYTVRVLL